MRQKFKNCEKYNYMKLANQPVKLFATAKSERVDMLGDVVGKNFKLRVLWGLSPLHFDE